MNRSVLAGAEIIEYELTFKKVKIINLRVQRDGKVCVSANRSVSIERIDAFVVKNAEFIKKAKARFAQVQPVETNIVYLLGNRYECIVRKASRDNVRIEDNQLILETPNAGDSLHEQTIMRKYLDKMCEDLFKNAVLRMLPLVEPYGVHMPRIRQRYMKTRWGSCTPARGSITLNTALIHFPVYCIEHVVLHELCHFVHPNHSADFYALLTKLMPDWRECKAELEKGAFMLKR